MKSPTTFAHDEDYPIMGDESIMEPKTHGTSHTPVQASLRWDCDRELADEICNFSRYGTERPNYFTTTEFPNELESTPEGSTMDFYDSNTGRLLFRAPVERTKNEFIEECRKYQWLSFRDKEVVWRHVRCLLGGEVVSVDGTHLGINLPDATGRNRYAINLVSVAGRPN